MPGFFTRIRPYGAGYLTNFSLGREVLVIAGNAVFTGVNNIAYMLFSSYPWMSGKVLCVLGGTATMIGGMSVYANAAQLQLGWGIDLTTSECTLRGLDGYVWVGRRPRVLSWIFETRCSRSHTHIRTVGGVLVTIGWSYAAANGALLRVGGGQFGVGTF
jgi:hypothetical protein